MYITWHGHSCFKIISKNIENEVVIVTDPFGPELGLKIPRLFADIVTVSHDNEDHNNAKSVHGTASSPEPFLVEYPGEFEAKKVLITGVKSYHDNKGGSEFGHNVIFRFDLEGISVAHLGGLGQKELDENQLNELVNVDILLIPIGGQTTIDAKAAVNIINQLDPRIIIPMQYKTKGLKKELDSLDKFEKELGLSKVSAIDKFRINKKELQAAEKQLVLLEIS